MGKRKNGRKNGGGQKKTIKVVFSKKMGKTSTEMDPNVVQQDVGRQITLGRVKGRRWGGGNQKWLLNTESLGGEERKGEK